MSSNFKVNNNFIDKPIKKYNSIPPLSDTNQ